MAVHRKGVSKNDFFQVNNDLILDKNKMRIPGARYDLTCEIDNSRTLT